jgi:hypothetical protein
MSTRAAQIELLADPLLDPTTGSLCSGYLAEFYSAGTSTAKNVWTEKEKTNPFTTYTLDSGGTALLYGDGEYKIIVKNISGLAVLTLDNIKIQANTYSVVSKTNNYTVTPDDDVVICTGTFTLSLDSVVGFTHEVVIKVVSGTVTLDPYSTQTIDGVSTISLTTSIVLYPDIASNTWRSDTISLDAADMSFLPYGTGAVTRTAQSKMREVVSVKDFGALGDNSQDDAAAIQAAIDSISSGTVLFPAGAYKIGTAISITKTDGITLQGSGRDATYIIPTANTMNTFNIAQDKNVVIENMTLAAGITKTGGAGIVVNGASAGTCNSGSRFSNLTIYEHYNGIDFQRGDLFWVENCYFLSNINYGAIVRNSAFPDSGDGTITSCQFNSPSSIGSGVLYNSGGGLRVINNKFWNHNAGLILNPLDGNTSQLIISGNNFDSQTVYGVYLRRSSGVIVFLNVIISGNTFSGNTDIDIVQSDASWLNSLVITGNTFIRSNTSSAIQLDGVSGGLIGNNLIYGQGGASKGIVLVSNTSNITIPASNNFYNINTPIEDGSTDSLIAPAQFSAVSQPADGSWGVGTICWHSDATTGQPLGWYKTVSGFKALANLA